MSNIRKPLILELDGIIGQLPNGSLINAGGTSFPTFTVGGKGLLFDDGSSTAPGGASSITLQSTYNNSLTSGLTSTQPLISLAPEKSFTIGIQDNIFLSLDSISGDLSLSNDIRILGNAYIRGNTTIDGLINGVDVVSLKYNLDNHLAGDPGFRHLATDIDILAIPQLPAGTNTVQAALQYLADVNSSDINLRTALGPGINSNGSFNPDAFVDINNILVDPTSFTDAIVQLANAFVTQSASALSELTDVNLNAPLTNKQFLRYDGTKWTNGSILLNDIANFAVSTPAPGDIIYFNGTDFVNDIPGSQSGVQPYSSQLENFSAASLTPNSLIYSDGTNQVATTPISELGKTIVAQTTPDGLLQSLGAQASSDVLSTISNGGLGLVTMSGTSVSFRTLQSPDSGITIQNADGAAGNPTLALTGDLAALENLTTTGLLVRTADSEIQTREIVGTPQNIDITNTAGINGNIQVNLAEVVNPQNDGSLLKVAVDSYGRVINSTPITQSDISTLVDGIYVNSSGDTVTGTLEMSNGATITGLPQPATALDAVNKEYVDTKIAGLSWKDAVTVASTENINVLTGLVAGSVIDGVTLALGDRVLLKDQTIPSENGIYVVSDTLTRSLDLYLPEHFDGSAVFIKEGTQNQSTGWTQTQTVLQVGTDSNLWTMFSASLQADGSEINLGSATQGNMSGAVNLTTSTSVANSIALLNELLAKLVPQSPLNFPGNQTLVIQSLSSYRMTNFVQQDNTAAQNKNVPGGTIVANVKRTSSYDTNVIANTGPGNKGTISAYVNGVIKGSVALSNALNAVGSYSDLVITANSDYNIVNSSTAPGFWSIFSSKLQGTVSSGWNTVSIADSETLTQTNDASWYYDNSSPGAPQFSVKEVLPPSTETLAYSSTIPHYTSANQFTVRFNVNRLSGDLYPITDNFLIGTARGAFNTPVTKTYVDAGITVPLQRNLYVASGSQQVATTTNIITGFGSSALGPSISVSNSYSTTTENFDPGKTILYKTGTLNALEETNIRINGVVGSGTSNAFRIINPGSSNTPVISQNAAAFNSQTSTLTDSDATIVAGKLAHDVTNYSVGYLPIGPNLSVNRSGDQYFTFKLTRSSVSKFDIVWTGTIAGLWIAVPGTDIDSTSTINGWLDASLPYAGAGIPGENENNNGNGSNGCSLGTTAPLNTYQNNTSITITLGTISSSNSSTNEIYVRLKLTAGQIVTALSLQTASN